VFHCGNQAFRIAGFLGCSPNVNSSWCREQREGRLIWPYHARVSSYLFAWCPDFMAVSSSFTHLSITFSNQRFSNCSSPTMGIGFVKLTSGSFCGNRVFKIAAVVLWFFETIFLNVRRSLSMLIFVCQCWFSTIIPLRWCLPTIRACRRNLRNCRSR
jgi:hypothetical protein